MNLKKLFCLIFSVFFVLIFTGCTNNDNKKNEPKKSSKKSTKINEKVVRLSVYDGFDYSLLNGFEKKTKYRLKITNLGNPNEVLQSSSSNKGNPVNDVVVGANNNNFWNTDGINQLYETETDIKKVNKLIPLKQPRDKDTKEWTFSYDNRFFAPVEYFIYSVKIDTNWFYKKNITPPKTFKDLFKKKYKKLFVLPNPTSSIAGSNFLYAIRAHFGPNKWQKYEEKIITNKKLMLTSNEATASKMWSKNGGKYPITVGLKSKNKAENISQTQYLWVYYATILSGDNINVKGATALMDFFTKKFKSPANVKPYPYNLEYRHSRSATGEIFNVWKSF